LRLTSLTPSPEPSAVSRRTWYPSSETSKSSLHASHRDTETELIRQSTLCLCIHGVSRGARDQAGKSLSVLDLALAHALPSLPSNEEDGMETRVIRTVSGWAAVASLVIAHALAGGVVSAEEPAMARSRSRVDRRVIVSIRDCKLALLENDRVVRVY